MRGIVNQHSYCIEFTSECMTSSSVELCGVRGMKKSHPFSLVEEAVRWRVLDQTAEEVRAREADLPADELEAAIDEAVRDVRADARVASDLGRREPVKGPEKHVLHLRRL